MTMDCEKTLWALKRMKVETGSLLCAGCGNEHDCGIRGCAILRNAVEHMEALLTHYDHQNGLLDERERYIIQLQKELHEAKSELEAAVRGQETLQKALEQHINAEKKRYLRTMENGGKA